MWQSLEILDVFNILTLKQIFWKTKTFAKKLQNCFLFENTKPENAIFWYKTALSEVSVKANRILGIKWVYHNEQNFKSNNSLRTV